MRWWQVYKVRHTFSVKFSSVRSNGIDSQNEGSHVLAVLLMQFLHTAAAWQLFVYACVAWSQTCACQATEEVQHLRVLDHMFRARSRHANHLESVSQR
jgi:hypothetical protein